MLSVDRREGVVLVRMDDGKVNAMSPAFVERFSSVWRDATSGGEPVVLLGNAKAFSAGLDLKALPELDAADLTRFVLSFLGVFRDVLAYPRPVVAAVDGPAIAGGAVLALAADVRIVTSTARVGLTEVPVGVPFPRPVLELARARLPPDELPEALLGGAVREGAALVERGWAQRFVPRERLVDEVVAAAREFGGHSRVAWASAKGPLGEAALASFHAFGPKEAEAWAEDLTKDETVEALLRTLTRLSRK